MNGLRIGFVCTEYPPGPHGGIGRFVKNLAEALVRRGHTIFVLVQGFTEKSQIVNGVCIDSAPAPPSIRPSHLSFLAGHWKFARVIRRWILERQLQLVEIPDWKSPAAFLRQLGKPQIPVIIRCHGSTTAYAQMRGIRVSRLVYTIEKRGLASADHVVCVSRTIRDATEQSRGPLKAPCTIIPNFVSGPFLEAPHRMESDSIVFAGRISHAKGADLLFRELPEILRKNPNVSIHLAGSDTQEGPSHTSLLRHLMSSLSRSEQQRVVHEGWVTQQRLRDLYLQSRCAIFPSAAEAFGLVAIEAMACACPPVVPQASCFTEFVDDGIDGLHFDRSTAGSLASRVTRVLADDELRSAMGSAAREKVMTHYSEGKIVSANLELYTRVIEDWNR